MRIRYDNKLFAALAGIMDIIWISMLWYICCLPIFTIGTASTAMYYTTHKQIFAKEGYLFSTFKKAFAENFKKGTIIWLISLLLDGFLVFDFLLARMAIDQNNILAFLYYPVLIFMVMAIMWQFSIMAYQARFEDSVKNVLVKSAGIAFSNLGWMLFLLIFLGGAIYLCRYLIVLVVLLPGGFACMMHHVFEHIYKKIGWIKEEKEETQE